jgi:hypothetical protein
VRGSSYGGPSEKRENGRETPEAFRRSCRWTPQRKHLLHPRRPKRSSRENPGRLWCRPRRPDGPKEKLAAARAYGDAVHCSAVMIDQGGHVVDQWGDIDKKIDA